MDPFSDARAEFWGDLQSDLYTKTSALFLANQTLESVLSTDGRKVHKSILSQPSIRDYVPHQDITFDRKRAEKQTLEVTDFPSAAEVIDITERNQSPYELVSHSSRAIRQGLVNRSEQLFLSNIKDAGHAINGGGAFELKHDNVLEVVAEADGTLGAFDAPTDTNSRALVVGPRTAAVLRRAKAERFTPLGDQVLENGFVGPWQGWTVVQNNNLPWRADLKLGTNPVAGDTVTIMGRVFEFVTSLASATAGRNAVLIGANVSNTRANLKNAIEGGAGAGTTYAELDNVTAFMLRNKRYIRATDGATMKFTGFGDITVSASLTAAADEWANEEQDSIYMVRGAIDLVLQFMDLQIGSKEKGFADLPKGIIGVGSKMFQDGAQLSVRQTLDVSGWNK